MKSTLDSATRSGRRPMKENSKTANLRAMESIYGQIRESTKENGTTV